MTYLEAKNQILNLKSLGIMPGLSRIKKLLQKLDNPQDKIKVIHVAGTNGKGTISQMICDSLIKAGYKVGLFTSPFVVDYREQIQINNEYISEDDFAYEFERCHGDGTEFEILTAMMYDYFCNKKVDYAVVECGMGGEFDSTNVISSPTLCVITSVSVDHQNFLGNTVEEIAKNKAGIIKPNSNVVLYPNKTQEVFKHKCEEMDANLFIVNDYKDFFINNMETAKMALCVLGEKVEITYPNLPARQEMIGDILLDGSHNVDGARSLITKLSDKKITAIIGMMKDKNYDDYLKIISPYVSQFITTTPSNSRSLSSKQLMNTAKKYCNNVTSIDNPHDALHFAKKQDYDLLLICGSFYLAEDIRKDII